MNKTITIKKLLMLAGISIISFFVFTILHNLFYGLAIITDNIFLIKKLMEILHVGFFLISIFICPLGLLVGVIGSIILFVKNKLRKNKSV